MMFRSFLLTLLMASSTSAYMKRNQCTNLIFTFNAKPKFIDGVGTECTEMENNLISQNLASVVTRVLTRDLRLQGVTVGEAGTDGCPEFSCDPPDNGDKCLPYCLTAEVCGETKVKDPSQVLSLAELATLQVVEVDDVRASIPACLGLKHKFNGDMYVTLQDKAVGRASRADRGD